MPSQPTRPNPPSTRQSLPGVCGLRPAAPAAPAAAPPPAEADPTAVVCVHRARELVLDPALPKRNINTTLIRLPVRDPRSRPRPGLRGHTPLTSPHAFVEPVPWFSTFALTYASRSAPRLSPPLEAERFELHLGYVSTAQSRIPPFPQSAPFLLLHMTAVVCSDPPPVRDACTVIKPSDHSQLPLSVFRSFGGPAIPSSAVLPLQFHSSCAPVWSIFSIFPVFRLLMGAARFTSSFSPLACLHLSIPTPARAYR